MFFQSYDVKCTATFFRSTMYKLSQFYCVYSTKNTGKIGACASVNIKMAICFFLRSLYCLFCWAVNAGVCVVNIVYRRSISSDYCRMISGTVVANALESFASAEAIETRSVGDYQSQIMTGEGVVG